MCIFPLLTLTNLIDQYLLGYVNCEEVALIWLLSHRFIDSWILVSSGIKDARFIQSETSQLDIDGYISYHWDADIYNRVPNRMKRPLWIPQSNFTKQYILDKNICL